MISFNNISIVGLFLSSFLLLFLIGRISSFEGSASSMRELSSDSGFIIKGYIRGIGSKKVRLGNKPNGYSMTFKTVYFDSCVSRNDSFYFKGRVDAINFYSIEIDGVKGWLSFILNNCLININGHSDSLFYSKVTGSIEEDAYTDYQTNYRRPLLKMHHIWYDSVDAAKNRNDTALAGDYLDSAQHYFKMIQSATLSFLKRNPDRYVSLFNLDENQSFLNLDTARSYYLLLSEKLKGHERGKNLYYKLFVLPNTIKIGGFIPNVALLSSTGVTKNLSSFRGKYVLLDFWASWCAPCIKEFPEMKTLYKKYGRNRFEILGVSLDLKRELFTKALEKYKIPWPTFCDFEGDQSLIFRTFDVKSIPFKLLINPEGKLIKVNPSLSDINHKLEEYF